MGMGGTIHPVYVCELTSAAFRGALAASGVSSKDFQQLFSRPQGNKYELDYTKFCLKMAQIESERYSSSFWDYISSILIYDIIA